MFSSLFHCVFRSPARHPHRGHPAVARNLLSDVINSKPF